MNYGKEHLLKQFKEAYEAAKEVELYARALEEKAGGETPDSRCIGGDALVIKDALKVAIAVFEEE